MKRPASVQAISACYVLMAAVTVVATGIGFWLSYAGLHSFDARAGLTGPEAWAWPSSVDLFILAGELGVTISTLRDGKTDWHAWVYFVAGCGPSVTFNVLHVALHAPGWGRYAVAATPPLAAVLALAALMQQIIGLPDALRHMQAAQPAAHADAPSAALPDAPAGTPPDAVQVYPWPRPAPVLSAPASASQMQPGGAPGAHLNGASGVRPESASGGVSRMRLNGASKGASGRASGAASKAVPNRTRKHVRAVVSDADAEVHFAADLTAGKLPSQRQIQRDLNVGQLRAKEIRLHLEQPGIRTAPGDERTAAPIG